MVFLGAYCALKFVGLHMVNLFQEYEVLNVAVMPITINMMHVKVWGQTVNA